MKQLILLLFLTAPALADGSVYLGPGQTQVVLDTPPPGYTRLEVQVNYRERVEYGHENLLFGYPTTVIANTYSGFGLIDEAHGYQTAAWHMTQRDIVDHLRPRDGVVDFAGPSGETHVFEQWHSVPPQVYGGTPSVLRYQRFSGEALIAGNVTSNVPLAQGTAMVHWRWIP